MTGNEVVVSGIVSIRDFKPYVQMMVGGKLVQMTMAEARSIAQHIETQCARAEADAMIRKFFKRKEFPQTAADALMVDFREFRSELDAEEVDTGERE